MAVIRHIDRHPFFLASQVVAQDAQLSLAARGLYALLVSMDDGAKIGARSLVKLSAPDDKAAINMALDELKEAGLVQVSKERYDIHLPGHVPEPEEAQAQEDPPKWGSKDWQFVYAVKTMRSLQANGTLPSWHVKNWDKAAQEGADTLDKLERLDRHDRHLVIMPVIEWLFAKKNGEYVNPWVRDGMFQSPTKLRSYVRGNDKVMVFDKMKAQWFAAKEDAAQRRRVAPASERSATNPKAAQGSLGDIFAQQAGLKT